MSTTVYVWNKGSSVGHCSLELEIKEQKKEGFLFWARTIYDRKQVYISFWPGDELQKMQVLSDRVSTMPESYNEDCSYRFCGRPADSSVTMTLPNEDRGRLERLKTRYARGKYNLGKHNCCTIVCDCLSILAGEKVFARMPSGVLREAFKLKGKFR